MSLWREHAIAVIAAAIVVAFFIAALFAQIFFAEHRGSIIFQIFPALIACIVSAMMALLPIIVASVQTTQQKRQLAKLDSIQTDSIKTTFYCKVAQSNIEAIKPVQFLDEDYKVPIIVLASVTMFLALVCFLGLSMEGLFFRLASPVLGGLRIIENFDANLQIQITKDTLQYQESTFIAACFAFQGAYVYMIFRLLDRVNTNDIYPISFYYYTVRMVAACLVAGVLRHVVGVYGIDKPFFIALISFLCGIYPDLLLVSLTRQGFALARIIGVQRDPEEGSLPTNYNLLMIKGLGRNQADRLIEMGIENAQVLSCQNPFTLWTRLPFDLRLIVDWIAQAQLYKYVGESGLSKLRPVGVENAPNFLKALSDDSRHDEIAKRLESPKEFVAVMKANMEADPSVKRLNEVYDAL